MGRSGERELGFAQGLKSAVPVALGYLPYGTAFGLLAQSARLGLGKTLLMSTLVYAGTAQLIAVGMIQTHQPLAAIVTTTFFVNLRYFLMSTALSQRLKNWPSPKRGLIAYYLSDETFALLSAATSTTRLTFPFALGVNTLALIAWIFSSLLGFALYGIIPDLKALGFDYALIAVFVALLFILIRDRLMILVAIIAGGLSMLFRVYGVGHFSVLLASALAATFALRWEGRWKTQK
jgi:4-azaleucine resistance transporter AzlC